MNPILMIVALLAAACVSCRQIAQPVVNGVTDALFPPRELTVVLMVFHADSNRWPTNTIELEDYLNSRGFALPYAGYTNLVMEPDTQDSLKLEYDLTQSASSGHVSTTFGPVQKPVADEKVPPEEIDDMLRSVLKTRPKNPDSATKEMEKEAPNHAPEALAAPGAPQPQPQQ